MYKFYLIVFSLYIVSVIIALIINNKNKKIGLKGIDVIECFNPFKFLSVAYGYLLKLLIPHHVFEQYVLRFYDEDCSVCIENGKCIGGKVCGSECGCGCDVFAKMYSPLEKDSGGNWDSIVFNKDKYSKIRDEYPIEISIKYLKKE